MAKAKKDLRTLLIELDQCNKRLEEIRKPESEYIENRVKEIYGDKIYHTEKDVENIIKAFF